MGEGRNAAAAAVPLRPRLLRCRQEALPVLSLALPQEAFLFRPSRLVRSLVQAWEFCLVFS